MRLVFKLAWRNIWRHPKRSIVTMLLCLVCTAFLIFFEAFNDGSHLKMIRDATEMYSGYIQVQEEGYKERPDMDHFLKDLGIIQKVISKEYGVASVSPRLEVPALFSSDELSYGGLLIGIDPTTEAQVSRIQRMLVTGRFLSSTDTNGVYMGVDLAKKLKVGLGDSLIFLSSAMDRSMAVDRIQVIGLFETNLFGRDAQLVFMNKAYMDEMFLSHNMASYLVVKPPVPERAFELQAQLQSVVPKGVVVLNWRELLSNFVQFVELEEAMGRLSVMVLVLVVFFVIMIFQFISIYGRTREIGMMRAMGTPLSLMIWTVLMETILMMIMSVVIGVGIGIFLSHYFEANPIQINLPEEVLEMYQQFGMVDMFIPSRFSWQSVRFGVIVVILINFLAIIFPMKRVLGLLPREALQGK